MSERALIHGKIYTFLESLSSLDQNERLILCVNDSDEKYACTVKLWQENLILPEKTALVHSGSTAKEKIEFFLSLYSKEEKTCMHGGITAPKPKKADILPCANMNGIQIYATRKSIDARNAQTVNSCR